MRLRAACGPAHTKTEALYIRNLRTTGHQPKSDSGRGHRAPDSSKVKPEELPDWLSISYCDLTKPRLRGSLGKAERLQHVSAINADSITRSNLSLAWPLEWTIKDIPDVTVQSST